MEAVLSGNRKLKASNNPWDWLGSGIYFWEHGYERALEWARESLRRKGAASGQAAVLGAIIQLGNCFDLLDIRYTKSLLGAFELLEETLAREKKTIPINFGGNADGDLIMRHLDCAVINFAIELAESDARSRGRQMLYDSVRGAFEEGEPAFPGACVRQKTHIQIAVREPSCIVGYFRPAR